MRRIRLTMSHRPARATARLLDSKAPRTCDALWKQLERPLRLSAKHAMWTGPEVSMQIPPDHARPDLDSLPPENQTVFPQAGALVWAFLPPYAFGGHPSPLYDLGLFYGPQGRLFLPIGWVACNHFAQMEDDWEDFRKACQATLTLGAEEMLWERVE